MDEEKGGDYDNGDADYGKAAFGAGFEGSQIVEGSMDGVPLGQEGEAGFESMEYGNVAMQEGSQQILQEGGDAHG